MRIYITVAIIAWVHCITFADHYDGANPFVVTNEGRAGSNWVDSNSSGKWIVYEKDRVGYLNPSYGESSCLFFTPDELSEIRERLSSGALADPYNQIIFDADSLLDPLSEEYADPTAVANGYSEQPEQTRGSLLCRRLSRWIETLGFAYLFSQDQKYADHAVEILLNACDRLPLDGPVMSVNMPGGRGDMIHALAFGYDLLGETMSNEQKDKVFRTGELFVEDAINTAQDPGTGWYMYHNWNGVTGGAVGLFSVAVCFDYPEDSVRWRHQAVEILERWFNNGFDEQGAYLEGIDYSLYGLNNSVLFAAALLKNGGPNLFDHALFKVLPQFYAASLLPGLNVYEARNDSNYIGISALALALAKFNHDGVSKWLWNKTGRARPWQEIIWNNNTPAQSPEDAGVPKSLNFSGRGLCIWRTGWESDDLLFSIEAGPYYAVTHNQADKGSFGFYSHAQTWAMDAGYGNNREPQGRCSTFAHNCVLIDGQGQAVSGAGVGTNGKILNYRDTPLLGRCTADASEAYNVNNQNQAGVGVEFALRHAVFVKPGEEIPAYAVIFDDVKKDSLPHEYTWQMLTQNDMNIALQPDGAVLQPSQGTARCVLKIAAASELLLNQTVYHPDDGRRPEVIQKIRAQCTAVNPSFAAVLFVLNENQEDPLVHFENDQGLMVRIIWPSRTDTVFWPEGQSAEPVVHLDI